MEDVSNIINDYDVNIYLNHKRFFSVVRTQMTMNRLYRQGFNVSQVIFKCESCDKLRSGVWNTDECYSCSMLCTIS